MTIDTLIEKLQEIKKTIPGGGNAIVAMCDDLAVQRLVPDEDGGPTLYLTDSDENGQTSFVFDEWDRAVIAAAAV